MPGEYQVTLSSEVTTMKTAFRKRSFLSSASADRDSYVHAVVEDSNNGGDRWGSNILTIADCRRRVQLEFFLGTRRERRRSLAKINLLINVLTRFREALKREVDLIEKFK
jgi:hypothetical protein